MYINHKVHYVNKTPLIKDEFFCKICDYPLVSFKDFTSQKEYHCCNDCFLKFAESRKEDWKNGWRPNKKAINDYIKVKKQIHECIINIKEK